MTPDLKQAAADLRTAALQHDDDGHDLRELAFWIWCEGTVYPAAVDRWISEIGGRA